MTKSQDSAEAKNGVQTVEATCCWSKCKNVFLARLPRPIVGAPMLPPGFCPVHQARKELVEVLERHTTRFCEPKKEATFDEIEKAFLRYKAAYDKEYGDE